MQDEQNLPIDIHFNKLLDWLINRRHCKQQWQPNAFIIQEKINAALKDLPETTDIKSITKDKDLTYFQCKEIVNLLKDTEDGGTNFFGQYSSQKMKLWADVIKRYEKEGIYLAETSQMLMRNVSYEIPALKKQIAKCVQIQKECDKKENDYANKVVELRKKYTQSCKDLGIKGDKIKSELAALVQDLPKVYDGIADKCLKLGKAVQYYQGFSSFLLHRTVDDTTPLLRKVISDGNITTYEWKHGAKPISVQENAVVIDTTDEQDVVLDVENIDWGDVDAGTEDNAAEIDFDISGITLESGGTQEGKLDLDVETLGEEISWDEPEEVVLEKGAEETSEEGVAKGQEALTVLDNPLTRNVFLDDLLELEAFLKQRVSELQVEGSVLTSSQFQNAPHSVQLDKQTVQAMLGPVAEVKGQLTSTQIQHLMLIRDSPRYVDRLKDSLKQMLVLADKTEFYSQDVNVRRQEANQEQMELAQKLSALEIRTKTMKKQMEAEISKKYKNRPVNIIGEINTI